MKNFYYLDKSGEVKGPFSSEEMRALNRSEQVSGATQVCEQGTNQNRLRKQDMDKIVDTFRSRAVVEKYSNPAKFEEIEENDFNLNIPRYVDTFEPEPEIDMEEVQKDIERINGELVEVKEKMEGYLKEMGFKS